MGKANKKYEYEQVVKTFKINNCQLLEEKYINSNVKMEYRCSCGNISKISFSKFIIGQRCRKCSYVKTFNKRRFSLEYIKAYFESHKCKLLQDYYTNCFNPVKYQCVCGNVSTISFANFKHGHRCKLCMDLSGENHPQWNPDREQIKRNKLFRNKCYGLLFYSLRVTGRTKKSKTYKLLGYTPKELQLYIESHPDWIKVKNCDWHLDHIFPIKAFVDYGIFDLKIINCLENLRPCKKMVNLRKSCKYSKEKFEQWLKYKKVI